MKLIDGAEDNNTSGAPRSWRSAVSEWINSNQLLAHRKCRNWWIWFHSSYANKSNSFLPFNYWRNDLFCCFACLAFLLFNQTFWWKEEALRGRKTINLFSSSAGGTPTFREERDWFFFLYFPSLFQHNQSTMKAKMELLSFSWFDLLIVFVLFLLFLNSYQSTYLLVIGFRLFFLRKRS